MGKLLGYQLKTHFKKNWFLVVLPILLIIINLVTKTFTNRSYVNVAAGIIFIIALVVYGSSIIVIIVSDYNRFYGKEALFYNSLPVTPGQITFARLLYYFILFFVHTLIWIINFVAFVIINGFTNSPDFLEELPMVKEEIMRRLSFITPKHVGIIILLIVIFSAYGIGKFMFAISLSGEKKLNKMDFGGAVLCYIIITALSNSVIIPFINRIATDRFDIVPFPGDSLTLNLPILLIYSVLGILFLVGTYFEHKRRVSVS